MAKYPGAVRAALSAKRNVCETVMAERPVKMTLPDGRIVDGVEVDVDESNERWTDITFKDRTRLRVKITVISAMRANGEYDQLGNPMYALNMTPVIAVTEVPERLKRKGH